MKKKPLPLHEEILLLALRNDKGTIAGSYAAVGLGAAILAELIDRGACEIEREKKKSFLRATSHRHLGDEILDDCLRLVLDRGKRQQLKPWVQKYLTSPLNYQSVRQYAFDLKTEMQL